MTKQITNKGALSVGIDIVLMSMYFIGGICGIMYASVITDLTMWFILATSIYLLFGSLELVTKITKPLDNYDTKEVVTG
jgi:uncharacterized membrane protein YoaK (UPF0700 family)